MDFFFSIDMLDTETRISLCVSRFSNLWACKVLSYLKLYMMTIHHSYSFLISYLQQRERKKKKTKTITNCIRSSALLSYNHLCKGFYGIYGIFYNDMLYSLENIFILFFFLPLIFCSILSLGWTFNF